MPPESFLRHVTPTNASWLNRVELWFKIIARQEIWPGPATSPEELIRRIEAFAAGRNARSRPFARPRLTRSSTKPPICNDL